MSNDDERLQHLCSMPNHAYLIVDKATAHRLSAASPLETYLGRFNIDARDLGNGQFKIKLKEAQ